MRQGDETINWGSGGQRSRLHEAKIGELHDAISKMDAPILLQNSTCCPQGKDMKRSTFGVSKSKVKITQHQS